MDPSRADHAHHDAAGATPAPTDHPVWRKVQDARFVMLTTLDADESIHSCPMTVRHEDGRLWCFTSAAAPSAQHIAAGSAVAAIVMDDADSFYVTLTCEAQLLDDREKMRALWSAPVQAWFPQGVDDPSLRLICMQPQRMEYWDSNASALVRLALMATAYVSGRPPAGIGTHDVVDGGGSETSRATTAATATATVDPGADDRSAPDRGAR
ncbi:MAG: pyridoxamine 5'-phosphate oxidase family protein [Burkholderiaceae bacterium]|jgi:general stress protein 26|nr:pyridoxamine 5'-phosphate oxidase family protein [Burkholderiaceae bacterium]